MPYPLYAERDGTGDGPAASGDHSFGSLSQGTEGATETDNAAESSLPSVLGDKELYTRREADAVSSRRGAVEEIDDVMVDEDVQVGCLRDDTRASVLVDIEIQGLQATTRAEIGARGNSVPDLQVEGVSRGDSGAFWEITEVENEPPDQINTQTEAKSELFVDDGGHGLGLNVPGHHGGLGWAAYAQTYTRRKGSLRERREEDGEEEDAQFSREDSGASGFSFVSDDMQKIAKSINRAAHAIGTAGTAVGGAAAAAATAVGLRSIVEAGKQLGDTIAEAAMQVKQDLPKP